MRKIIMMCLLVICFSILLPGYDVQASSGLGEIKAFDSLSGENKYLGSRYRDNYYLDVEEVGLIDPTLGRLMNGIANIIFGIIRFGAYVVVCVFYWSMNLDLGILLSGALNEIQSSLNEIIFKPLFILAFCGVAFVLIKKIVRRDMMGMVSEFAKVILIIYMSIMVIEHSDVVLSTVNNITKGISVEALTGINNADSSSHIVDFTAEAAGVLWNGMIHEPWVMLEFGGEEVSDETIDKYLTTSPLDESARADLVKNHPNSEDVFSLIRASMRPSFLIVYLCVFLIKAAIYLAVAGMQLVFQVLSCFYMMLAPIILLLAMLPGYDLNIISTWFRKILENQLSVLVLTFFIGLLLKFDGLLYENFSDTWGWMGILFFQAMLSVGLFFGRNKILNMFSNIQKGITSPGYAMARYKRSGSETYKQVGERVGKTAQSSARIVRHGINQVKGGVTEHFKRPRLEDAAAESEMDTSNIIQFNEVKHSRNQRKTGPKLSNRFDSLREQYSGNGNWGNGERRFIPQKGAKLDLTKKSNLQALKKMNLDTSRLKQAEMENASNSQSVGSQQNNENTAAVSRNIIHEEKRKSSDKPNLEARNLQKSKKENQDTDVKTNENSIQKRPNLSQRTEQSTERAEEVNKKYITIRTMDGKTYRLHNEDTTASKPKDSPDKVEQKAVKEVKNKKANVKNSADHKVTKQRNIEAPQMAQRKAVNRRM